MSMSIKDLKVQSYPGHEAKERRECCFFWGVNNLNKNTKYLGGMVKPNVCQQKGLFAVYYSCFGNKDGGFQWNLSDVSRIFRGTYGLLWKGRACFFFQFPTLKSRFFKSENQQRWLSHLTMWEARWGPNSVSKIWLKSAVCPVLMAVQSWTKWDV